LLVNITAETGAEAGVDNADDDEDEEDEDDNNDDTDDDTIGSDDNDDVVTDEEAEMVDDINEAEADIEEVEPTLTGGRTGSMKEDKNDADDDNMSYDDGEEEDE
jgi:hypothetical protein